MGEKEASDILVKNLKRLRNHLSLTRKVLPCHFYFLKTVKTQDSIFTGKFLWSVIL
jgi:hypothetical protein